MEKEFQRWTAKRKVELHGDDRLLRPHQHGLALVAVETSALGPEGAGAERPAKRVRWKRGLGNRMRRARSDATRS